MIYLSNTATPRYYHQFRELVRSGDIPVCKEVSMEMQRIDALIRNPGVYYDPQPVECFINFCEAEMTLTDGSPLKLLDSFKLWAEQVFGWYYFVERSIPVTSPDGKSIHYFKVIVLMNGICVRFNFILMDHITYLLQHLVN